MTMGVRRRGCPNHARLCQASAEHFQQCAESPLLRRFGSSMGTSSPMCPPVFDRHVSALDVTGVTQASVKSREKLACQFERCEVEKPDHRHRWLLPSRALHLGREQQTAPTD
jgi:hypothetical protein